VPESARPVTRFGPATTSGATLAKNGYAETSAQHGEAVTGNRRAQLACRSDSVRWSAAIGENLPIEDPPGRCWSEPAPVGARSCHSRRTLPSHRVPVRTPAETTRRQRGVRKQVDSFGLPARRRVPISVLGPLRLWRERKRRTAEARSPGLASSWRFERLILHSPYLMDVARPLITLVLRRNDDALIMSANLTNKII
jgi:hypothetical protein